MSRRRAFDTGLTEGDKPNSNHSNPTNKPRGGQPNRPQARSNASSSLQPRVSPPSAEHASATVPTREHEAGDQVDGGVNGVVAKDGGQGAEVGTNGADMDGEDGDDDMCIICAEPITYWSVGVCGHKTCHICAVRLRTFYKKYECTFCKTVTPSLLFSSDPNATFPTENHLQPSPPAVIAAAQAGAEKLEKGKVWYDKLTLPGTLDLRKFPHVDDKLGVVFQDEELMEQTLLLLRFNCPSPECDHMGEDWQQLERHTLSAHGRVICRVCRSQLSRFAHEQTLYPPHLLALHDPTKLRGSRPPKPRGEAEIEMVKSWDAPHPVCEFCHSAFFGPDELFAHMRKSHEECHVCKSQGESHVYFKNYDKLNEHFNADHYPCMQPGCLEQKFVVFGNEMDLRAHLVSEHGEHMSSRDRAQARQLNIDFQSRPESRRPPRNERGNSGRGFSMAPAPQAQQLASTPLMTPEQAAQHQRQLQTDQREESRRKRGFNTELTDSRREQQSIANPRTPATRSGFATPREDVDDATADRHSALLARVTMLVGDSDAKMQSFRSAVRQFKTNESAAKDLIDTVFNVLDRDLEATTGVIREVAGLFDGDGDKDKQRAILESLNGFRVQQREQFPALHHPTGQGAEWAGITSGKILNAKRTTHTTGRGGTSQAVWDRVEAAAGSSSAATRVRATAGANGRYVPGATSVAASGAFPALGAAGPSTAGSSKGAGAHSTPWASGGAGSSSKAPSALAGPIIRSVNYSTGSTSSNKSGSAKPKPLNNAAFPSLPTGTNKGMSKEERQALFNKPTVREESIRRIMGGGSGAAPVPVGNGWGGGYGAGSVSAGAGAGSGVTEEMQGLGLDDAAGGGAGAGGGGGGGGGGKKKGKGKQLLFSVSARPS